MIITESVDVTVVVGQVKACTTEDGKIATVVLVLVVVSLDSKVTDNRRALS